MVLAIPSKRGSETGVFHSCHHVSKQLLILHLTDQSNQNFFSSEGHIASLHCQQHHLVE